MIASAASVAAAAGVGVLRLLGWGALLPGWGALLQCGVFGCRAGRPPVRLDGSFLQIGGAWLQIGQAFGRAGGLLLSAISAGLIYENQPTVCKGTAFSWNKYQK